MNKPQISTPAQDALKAEEATLRASVAQVGEDAKVRLSGLTKADLIERAEAVNGNNGRLPYGLKRTDPKDTFVTWLANEEAHNAPALTRLRELTRPADREEEIVRKAYKAETVEAVREEFPTALAKFAQERGWQKQEVLDLVLSFNVREVVATCWASVRFFMEEKGMDPQEALADVRKDTEQTIITRARYGYKSSSITSNITEESTTKGYIAFLDDLKYL